MLVALGECYEKLNQLVEAKKVSEGSDVLCSRLGIQVAGREAGRSTDLVSTPCPPELFSSAHLKSNEWGIVLRLAILFPSVLTLIPGWVGELCTVCSLGLILAGSCYNCDFRGSSVLTICPGQLVNMSAVAFWKTFFPHASLLEVHCSDWVCMWPVCTHCMLEKTLC